MNNGSFSIGCNGVTCYDCVYVKRGDVLEAGLKGCADPFNKLAAIPTINCNGFCSVRRMFLPFSMM